MERHPLLVKLSEHVSPATAWTVGAVAVGTFLLLWYRIFARTGYNGALGILMVVPGVNLILLFVLAFMRWPIERELRARRQGRI